MPKMKTRKGASKRLTVTKGGKVKFKRSNLRHILSSKTRKAKRQMRSPGFTTTADTGRIMKVMPYA